MLISRDFGSAICPTHLQRGPMVICAMDVNGAIALGAANAVMQTTAARCGMLTKDNYDDRSVRWSDRNPLRSYEP